jgi:hypothetical protein
MTRLQPAPLPGILRFSVPLATTLLLMATAVVARHSSLVTRHCFINLDAS